MISIAITFVIAYLIARALRSENEKGSAFTDAIIMTILVTLVELATGILSF